MSELTEKYPNQWVAVVNKEVVRVGRNLEEVEKVVRQKVDNRPPFCFFTWRIFKYRGSIEVRDDN